MPEKKYKKTGSGQNSFYSNLCIATNMDGSSCDLERVGACVPYCKKCMDKGDPSISVVQHPRFGKCVKANRDLPERYMTALFGEVVPMSFMTYEDEEWGFETPYSDFINPKKFTGSQTQYMQCPGPNEVVTSGFCPNPNLFMTESAIDALDFIRKEYEKAEKVAKKAGKDELNISAASEKKFKEFKSLDFEDTHGCMTFYTTKKVPKNHQLVMMYADNEKAANDFFKSRGMTRCDVWCEKYPTVLKARVKGDTSKLMTVPPKEDKVTADQSRSKEHFSAGATGTASSSSSSSSSSAMAKKKDTKKNTMGDKKEVKKGNDKKAPMKGKAVGM